MDESIIITIFKLDNMLRRMGNRIAGVLGATQQQWAVLDILNEAGPNGLPLSDLGVFLDVTKGNITGLVDRMERDDLAKRKDDPRDRRVIRAVITPKGKKILKEIEPLKAEWSSRVFAGFNSKDKKDLAGLLNRILERVIELEN